MAYLLDILLVLWQYVHRYHFILLCVYLNMQGTFNSAEKTTQLLAKINGTLPNIFILGDEQKTERVAEIKLNKVFASTAIGIAIGLSLTSSFIVGAIKSRMAEKSWIRSGIEMAVLGTGIALVGYGIGSELNKVGIVNVQGG
jgi:hypothetical protein